MFSQKQDEEKPFYEQQKKKKTLFAPKGYGKRLDYFLYEQVVRDLGSETSELHRVAGRGQEQGGIPRGLLGAWGAEEPPWATWTHHHLWSPPRTPTSSKRLSCRVHQNGFLIF